MPTLKEFIRSVLQKENIHGDVDKIAKEIEKEAKKQAINGIACICDEEVREMTINIADLMLKNPDAYKDKPKKETKHIDEEVVEEVKEEPKKVIEPKEQVKKVKEVKVEEPKETFEDEKPKKIEKGTFGKEMIVINVEQGSLF
mgnify:FL=1